MTLGPDIRHAIRVYARTPGASAMAVAILAIAMACVCAFLSLYVDLAVRPHPGFEDSGRLVTIGQNDGTVFGNISADLIDRIDREATSLQALAGYMRMTQRIGPAQESRPIEIVTRRFFDAIRPRLALGRGFDARDHAPDAEPVAVLSDAYWREALGADPGVIGTTIDITGRVPSFLATAANDRTTAFRIVGVVSPALPSLVADETALWLPYERAAPLYLGRLDGVGSSRTFRGIGRLADGAGVPAVRTELNDRYAGDVTANLSPGYRLDAVHGLVRDINVQRETARQLTLFLAGSVLLAFVAAANVSLFLLSRAPGRRRELGIRMAVGATIGRLGRQLATEAGLLVAFAAVLGILFSAWLARFLETVSFLREASWRDVTPFDWRVLALALAFLLLLAALVSLVPVLGLNRIGIAQSSRQVTSRPNTTQRLASTVQIAIAGAVGAAAVAFAWHLGILLNADHGFDASGLLVVTPGTTQSPGAPSIGLDADLLAVERERRRQAMLTIPGVDDVAFSSGLPGFDERVLTINILHPTRPGELVEIEVVSADRHFFEMLRPRFLSGGPWPDGRSDVLIVNVPAAERLWGKADATGELMPGTNAESGHSEVAGVLVGVPFGHPLAEVRARAYGPIFFYSAYEHMLVRTALSPNELRSAVESLIEAGALEISLESVRSLETVVADLIAPDRARGWLTVTAALLVLLVAAFGFYGTQQYLVSAGRREYAVRAAVGAGPRALGRLVLARGLALGLPGLVIAALLALIVAAGLRDEFVARAVSPPAVTLAVVAVIVALLLAASLGPALLAQRTRPAPLLRQE